MNVEVEKIATDAAEMESFLTETLRKFAISAGIPLEMIACNIPIAQASAMMDKYMRNKFTKYISDLIAIGNLKPETINECSGQRDEGQFDRDITDRIRVSDLTGMNRYGVYIPPMLQLKARISKRRYNV